MELKSLTIIGLFCIQPILILPRLCVCRLSPEYDGNFSGSKPRLNLQRLGNIHAIRRIGFYEPVIWNVLQFITYVLSLLELIETQTLRVNVGQISLGMSTGLYTPQLDRWFVCLILKRLTF